MVCISIFKIHYLTPTPAPNQFSRLSQNYKTGFAKPQEGVQKRSSRGVDGSFKLLSQISYVSIMWNITVQRERPVYLVQEIR